MKDVMITEKTPDGCVRSFRYGVRGGTLVRVNSAGDRTGRVCSLPVGADGYVRLSDIQLVYLVLDWHQVNRAYPGAQVEWAFCYN